MDLKKCRNCGYAYNRYTELSDESAIPKNGDISICLSCGYVGAFKGGWIVALSQKQYMELDEEIKARIVKIERARKEVMKVNK